MPGAEPARSRWTAAAAGALLLLYVLMAVSAASRESATFDEGLHLTAGYLHWTHPEERLWPENGVLAQAWAALPLLLDHPNVTRGGAAPPRNMEQWEQGYRFFYQMGNNPAAMLFQGRLMVSLLGAALGALVFIWSRELFGAAAGLVSLLLFAFCPTMLANGALVTADMASALGFLAATFCFWRLTHVVSARNLLLSVLALGGLVLSKMSSVLIVPVFLLILLVRLFSGRPAETRLGAAGRVGARRSMAAIWGVLIVLHALAAIGVLWLAYDFRYFDWGEEAMRHKAMEAPGFTVWTGHGMKVLGLEALGRSGLVPRAYVEGLSYVAEGFNRGVFALGSFSEAAKWWFFPLSFLVKTPISALALFALSLAALLAGRRASGTSVPSGGDAAPAPGLYDIAPLLILGGVFAAACLSSNINIGHRHLMPVYPVLFVLAGANVFWLRRSGPVVRAGVGILLAGAIVESLSIWPHYLAFFNRFVGGPRLGYHVLVDSSLDWGQDLPGLREWLDRNAPAGGATRVYLSYFGTAEPEYYGIRSLRLPDRFGLFPSRPFALQGGIYCVSASSLQATDWTRDREDQYWWVRRELARFAATSGDTAARMELVRRKGEGYWRSCFEVFDGLRFLRLCAYLKQREPDELVGYSILIYRLSDDVVGGVLTAAPPGSAAAPGPDGR